MIDLCLGDSNFQVIKFNQYDKNYTFDIRLTNYTPVQNDIVKIEWEINNKVAVIQSNITVNNNVLTVKLLREVTLNAGKGHFNVVVDNTKTKSRKATFKCPVEIVGNSIDEDTVSSVLIETVLEKLQNEEINANKVLTNLLKAISDGSLSNYLPLSGGTMTGNVVYPNGKGIRGTKQDGTTTLLAYTNADDINTYGNGLTPTRLVSKGCPTVYSGGKDNDILHEGNGDLIIKTIKPLLLDLLYPIGSIKPTENNVNPSTTLGGTWELVGQGKFIVGVGTGTDKNGVSKTFVAGANEGEYEHKITMGELPVLKSSDEAPEYGLLPSSQGATGFANRVIVARKVDEQTSIDLTSPSYGLYIWKRTA